MCAAAVMFLPCLGSVQGEAFARHCLLHPTSVLLAAAAAAAAVLSSQGQYQVKPPLPFIPGNEVAGVVVQVAPGVKGFRPGDLVSL